MCSYFRKNSVISQVLHNSERKQFRKFFQIGNINRFEERLSILEIFLKTEEHVTLLELLVLLKNDGINVDIKFVRDTLRLMCEYGFARKCNFDGTNVKYEHMHLKCHHDHMICVKCGCILEFRNDKLESFQLEIASNYGFHVLQHKMELYGLCSKCVINRNKFFCLTDISSGEIVLVVNFLGNKKFVSRLSSIGLRVGDELCVIFNSSKKQLVVGLGYRRLILCRDFAKKIIVSFAKK